MFSGLSKALGFSKPTGPTGPVLDPKIGDKVTYKTSKEAAIEGEVINRQGMKVRIKTGDKEAWVETKDVTKIHEASVAPPAAGAADNTEVGSEKKAADEKAAADKAEAEKKAAEEKAAADKAEAEKKAAEEKAAADKAEAEEKAASDKAEAEQKAADGKAAADKVDAEKKAAEEKAASDKAEAEKKAADEKAAADKVDAEKKAAEEKAAADKAEVEKKVVEEKAAADKAEAEKKAAEESVTTSAVIEGLNADQMVEAARKVFAKFPENRCVKHLLALKDDGTLEKMSPEDVAKLYKCAKTGLENEDSGLGCYASNPSDYDNFAFFFDRVINDYHNNPKGDKIHKTNWSLEGVEGLPADGVLDMSKLGLAKPLSMRVRVGRNLTSFPLPGAMTKADRVNFEKTMLGAFDKLIKNKEYGGQVYSMTPNEAWKEVTGEATNPNLITDAKYNELVKAHVMFKDMDADPFLKSAGISSDWPCGRGCYQSGDGGFIIWFGEEDQLRIMCMKTGFILNEVFDRLNKALQLVESIDGIKFATSSKYGYVTSCPSNLGTGMRASVHIQIPNLTAGGSDAKAKEAAKPLGLSVRGMGGEHTPIGADGTVDISPSNRLFITEAEIVTKLYNGIKLLMEKEAAAASGTPSTPAAASGGCCVIS